MPSGLAPPSLVLIRPGGTGGVHPPPSFLDRVAAALGPDKVAGRPPVNVGAMLREPGCLRAVAAPGLVVADPLWPGRGS